MVPVVGLRLFNVVCRCSTADEMSDGQEMLLEGSSLLPVAGRWCVACLTGILLSFLLDLCTCT